MLMGCFKLVSGWFGVVFDWFGVVSGCFGEVIGWCWCKMGGIGGIGMVSGGLGGIGVLMFGRWVVWVALGWLCLVDGWHWAGFGWYFWLFYDSTMVWWKVKGKDGIWVV